MATKKVQVVKVTLMNNSFQIRGVNNLDGYSYQVFFFSLSMEVNNFILSYTVQPDLF